MRRVANSAALYFRGRVLEYKRPLFVGVALHARGIRASIEPCLFQFESAVRVVAIAALHRAFQHLVMERLRELCLRLVVASHTQLRLVLHKHLWRRQVVGMRREGTYRNERRRRIGLSLRRASKLRGEPAREVRGVAIGASHVVAPVLAALVVVVLFLTGVALQAAFGYLLRRFVFESPNLGLISSAFHVRFAGTVTRFAALLLRFPAGLGKLGVGSLGEAVELLFVAGLAGFASNKVFRRVFCRRRRLGLLLIAGRGGPRK